MMRGGNAVAEWPWQRNVSFVPTDRSVPPTSMPFSSPPISLAASVTTRTVERGNTVTLALDATEH